MALVLILIATLAITYALIVVIRHFCCKRQPEHPINPFLAEAWVLKSEERYKAILKESPEIFYGNETNFYEQPKCVVCLSDFSTGQPIRVLSCRHIFHQGCIEEWIKAKINNIPKCPTCNTDLTKERPPGYVEPSSNQQSREAVESSSNLIPRTNNGET